MVDDSPPSSDRRRAARHIACFPSFVERDEARVTAMIADLAETGTRLFLQQPDLKMGDEVRLELHVMLDSDTTRVVTGRIVRIEPLPTDRASLWTHEIGVEFHETMPLSPAEIASLEKREAPFSKRTGG
jgi:Tfp pilus assembly protein PilZ